MLAPGRSLLVVALVCLLTLLPMPTAASAAELLQVRDATLLQLGDGNRSYGVRLACIAVDDTDRQDAITWLRRQLPRHARVNLRPSGQDDGVLVARIQKLDSATDLSEGLIAAGLAHRHGCS